MSRMTCTDARLHMSEHLDGWLREDEITALDRHLQQCTMCRARWQAMQHISLLLQSSKLAAPPPNFTAHVMRRLHERKARQLIPDRQEDVLILRRASAVVIIALFWLAIMAFHVDMPIRPFGEITAVLNVFSLAMRVSDVAIHVATVIDTFVTTVLIIAKHVPVVIIIGALWIIVGMLVLPFFVVGWVAIYHPSVRATQQASSINGPGRP